MRTHMIGLHSIGTEDGRAESNGSRELRLKLSYLPERSTVFAAGGR